MVDQQSLRPMLSALDSRDPNFPEQVRCEIAELIAGTKKTMAQSRELMAKIDEILAMR